MDVSQTLACFAAVVSTGANVTTVLDSTTLGRAVKKLLGHDQKRTAFVEALREAHRKLVERRPDIADVISWELVQASAKNLLENCLKIAGDVDVASQLAVAWSQVLSPTTAKLWQNDIELAAKEFLADLEDNLLIDDEIGPVLDRGYTRATERHTAFIARTLDQFVAEGSLTLTDSASRSHPLLSGAPPVDDRVLPQPDHLVGREVELSWILERLHSEEPGTVIALHGMAGIGKTALAAAAITQVRSEGLFTDGIVAVNCMGKFASVDVLAAIIDRYDLHQQHADISDQHQIQQSLQALIRGKSILIVLDNVEPGLAIEQVVVPLRQTGATLLVTARHLLPRSVTSQGGSRHIELLPEAEAIEVFAQAYGIEDASSLQSKDIPEVTRIVTVLGRHTLAVKLAGAYAADLGRDLAVLADDLTDPMRAIMLPEDETPAVVRQVIARSVEMLPRDIQRLFISLAVFQSSQFGRSAVQSIAEGLGVTDPQSATDLLVRRALLTALRDDFMAPPAAKERLHIHPLLQGLARSLLTEWTEDERTHVYHALADYYRGSLEKQRGNFYWLLHEEASIINLLEWAHERNEFEIVGNLCNAMQMFWQVTGRTRNLLLYLPWRVEAWDAIHDLKNVAFALRDLADAAAVVGQIRIADEAAIRAGHLFNVLGDHVGVGMALMARGRISMRAGQVGTAAQLFDYALTIFQSQEKRVQGLSLALTGLAEVAMRQEQHDRARTLLQEALEVERDLGDQYGEATVLHRLAIIEMGDDRFDEAEQLLTTAVGLLQKIGDRSEESQALTTLGTLMLNRAQTKNEGGKTEYDDDQMRRAEKEYQRALNIDIEIGDRQAQGVDYLTLGHVAWKLRKLDLAEQRFLKALEILHHVGDSYHIAEVSMLFGTMLLTSDTKDAARHDEGKLYLAQAKAVFDELGLSSKMDVLKPIVEFIDDDPQRNNTTSRSRRSGRKKRRSQRAHGVSKRKP